MALLISRLKSYLLSFLQRRADGPEPADPIDLRFRVEAVSIGLNERRKISKSPPPRAQARSFRPTVFDGRLELSTFCIDELDDNAIWQLLDMHSNKPPIPGRSDLRVNDVEGAGLNIDADWNPLRHVNILGWPLDEEQEMSTAQTLYDKQACCLRT